MTEQLNSIQPNNRTEEPNRRQFNFIKLVSHSKCFKRYSEQVTFLLIFITGAFLFYNPVLNNFFLSDDFGFIYQLSQKCPVSLIECLRRFGGALFFRPITSFSFYSDYLLWQLSPIGYHSINILVHGINSYLVFSLAKLLWNQLKSGTGSDSIKQDEKEFSESFAYLSDSVAVVAAVIFLILPSHSEAVTWISARSDLLVTCFILVAFISYISKQTTFWILSPIFFGLGLGSKESAIAYPGLLIIYHLYRYWQYKYLISSKKILQNIAIYGSIIVSYFSLRYLAIGAFIGGYGSDFNFQFPNTLISLSVNLIQYFVRTFFPPLGATALYCLSILSLAIFIWRSHQISKQIYLLSGFLFSSYLLFLLPVLNLSISLDNSQEERFLYLPSAFAIILLSIWLVTVLPNAKRRFWLGITSILICFTISLFNSHQVWQSAAQIAENTIKSLNTIESTKKIYILNLPDHYQGAYIFRNSFPRAIQLFLPGKFEQIETISFHNLEQITDQFLVLNQNKFQSLNPNLRFYFKHKSKTLSPQAGRLETSEYLISNFSDRNFSFLLPTRQLTDKVFYYSDQKLIEIANP